MAFTTATTVGSTIYAKIIDSLLLNYQYDEVTAVSNFRFKSMEGQPSAVASFPRRTKNAMSTGVAEGSALTAVAYTMTNQDVTVAKVGIAREVTNVAIEDSILGNALFVQELVKDAAILFGEQLDTDGTALFSSITASVGSTGTALTIATVVGALGSQRANKARGPAVMHLHDLVAAQLQKAQAASTALTWSAFFKPSQDDGAYLGTFLNCDIWSSSKNPTANASADRVGAVWVKGANAGGADDYCGLGFAAKRMPDTQVLPDPLNDAKIFASYARYGVGLIADSFCTKIIAQNA